VQNTIAKEIEKAHAYHFNLQNYRSGLTDEQVNRWHEVFNIPSIPAGKTFPSIPSPLAGEGQGEGDISLDERYKQLTNNPSPNETLKTFSTFDPRNALEIDIAREFLHKLPEGTLQGNEKLKTLEEIVKRGFQYPLVPLREFIKPKYEKIKKDDYKGDLDIVDKISFSDGKIHLRKQRQTGMDLYVAEVDELITSKINLHQGAVAVNNLGRLVCSTHYQVYHVNHSEVIPEYLVLMMRSSRFLDQISAEKNKGIKNEAGYEFISGFSIPLPPLDVQREIVAKIEKQKAIIEAVKRIEESWDIPFDTFEHFPKVHISVFAELNPPRNYLGLNDDFLVSFVPMEAIDEFSGSIKIITEKPLKDVKKGYTFFAENDVLFAKITPCMENGKIAIARNLSNGIGFGTTELHVFRTKAGKAIPKYIYYFLRTKYFREEAAKYMTGASGHKRVPEKFLMDFPYPLPPLSVQQEIVAKLDKEMEALKGVRFLHQEAERRIEKIIAEVWGEG
jgi:restriction endonuclease S subunit